MKHIQKSILLCFACIISLHLSAENKQTVTINGFSVEKNVREMTFEGDHVLLYFSDGTTQNEDLEAVNIMFDYDESSTAIARLPLSEEIHTGKVFNLNGQLISTSTKGLRKGVYVMNGKKIIIK